MNEFDIIVVGGGPAGATAAALLAQRGRRVALLEHQRFPRHKVCGDSLNPGCWPVLERLGVAANIRALPHHTLTGALVTTSTGVELSVPSAPNADWRTVRRSLFDNVLLEHARGCGVVVFEEATVNTITRGATGWEVRSKAGLFAAPTLIGGDGRHSMVARTTGLARGVRVGGAVALQGHFIAPAALDGRVQLHLFPGGYCGVVRIDDATANVCVVTDTTTARREHDVAQLFAATAERNAQFRALGILPKPLASLQSAHPMYAPMNHAARDGAFLVGDALRIVEPFTGQGVFFALRTAELAAAAISDIASSAFRAESYATNAKLLFRRRAQTNALLHRLLYRDRLVRQFAAALHRWPRALTWLARNVLAPEAAGSTLRGP